MRLLSFLLALLFSINSYAAGLSAPFSGSKLTGLTRNSTIAEYDSTVRESDGALLDLSGSNYFTYSEQFDNAAWTKSPGTSSITANNTKAPDGTTTADLFNEGTVGSGDVAQSVQVQPTLATGTYTISVYAKYRASGRSWLYIGCAGAANKYAWFNIQTGLSGTVQSLVSAYKIQPITGGWYRISVTTTDSAPGSTWVIRAASADNATTYTGAGTGAVYLWGAQLAQNDVWRVGPGGYHQTVAASKPLLDLAPTASPTESKTYFQGQDGRRLKSRTFNGTTQYYSKAHDASMNVFDTVNTMTFVFMQTSTGAGTDYLFSHGTVSTNGVQVFSDGTSVGVRWSGASTASADYTLNARDDRYHILQAVRTSSTVRILVDGILGQISAAVGGTAVSEVMYLGNSAALNRYWDGSILYARIDAEALSDVQLAKEREIIQGTLFGSGNLNPGSTFSRTTTATQTFSDGTFGYATTNIPRVGGDGGGVLIEEQRSNILTYSENQANAAWGVTNLTNPPVAYTGTDPAGTTTGYVLAEDGTAAAEHKIARSAWVTVTAGTTYTLSAYVKAINRDWTALHIYENGGTSYYAYFNVAKGTIGTTSGGPTTKIEQLANGWYRCSVTHAIGGGITQIDTAIYVAEADNDWTFNGATQSSLAVFGAQMEVGAHASSYIPTTSASVTRTADSLTIEPWKVTKPVVGTPNFAMYFDNDVYSGGTYTSEVGNYTFTVAGDTKHVESQTLNDYFSFDGAGDNLVITGTSDFSPATSFSLTTIVTPATISGTHAIATNYAGATYGWELFHTGDDVTFYIYNAGGNTSVAKADCLVANKTSLITVSFTRGSGGSTADSTTNIYVDGLAVATSSAQRVPIAATGLMLGDSGGTEPYNGKIHYMSFHSGTALSSAQHTAMYNAFKQANILPVKIGNSYEAKKLYVEFESRAEYSSATDIGDPRNILSISGNTGSAASNKNNFQVYALTDGKFYMDMFGDNDTTAHEVFSAASTSHNVWKKHSVFVDFTDLSKTSYMIDGVGGTQANCSGTENFDATNTLLRVGQGYTATTYIGDVQIRNLRIRATP